jgi:hypothetical protein
MATLAPLTKAPVLDQDGEMLGADGRNTHNVVSSDPAVADVQWLDWRPWIFARALGETTITATRYADGATATLELEVAAPVLPPFAISLGDAVPA